MDAIFLNHILKMDIQNLKGAKIRFLAVPSNDKTNSPLEKYKSDPSNVTDEWFLWKQEKQGNPFKEGQVGIGLLDLYNDRWLLVTVKKITKNLNLNKAGVNYLAEDVTEYKKYCGRIIIKYHRTSQQGCRKAAGLINELEVLEILSTQYEGDEFPGHENVTITWEKLKTIIDRQKKDWVSNLKNQKGIYLITDIENGKHYVGSASGKDMLLQRWSNYIKNGHGGNQHTPPQSSGICCSHKVFVFGFNTFMTAPEGRGIKPSTRIKN
jgi:hypothetical protein